MTPDEVETIATPRPPRTRGISVFRAYTRRPGRLMRRRPETAGCSPVSMGGVVSFVISISPSRSPTRLRHAGQLAHERALAEADPAQPELAHVAARATADLAAVIALHLELRRPLGLEDQALLGH